MCVICLAFFLQCRSANQLLYGGDKAEESERGKMRLALWYSVIAGRRRLDE